MFNKIEKPPISNFKNVYQNAQQLQQTISYPLQPYSFDRKSQLGQLALAQHNKELKQASQQPLKDQIQQQLEKSSEKKDQPEPEP